MLSALPKYRIIARVFWVLATITVIAWALQPGYVVGWDLAVYKAAILSLRAGHDPYLDATAIQRVYHAHLAEHIAANDGTPFAYVYSPITLPLVKLVSFLPLILSGSVYWLVYAAAALVLVWFGMQAVEPRERPIFTLLAPAALFFPGLLQQDVLFAGNIAYILYALVFLGAIHGWRKFSWLPFYVAAVFTSCVKAPLLILVLIPAFTARRQWLPTLAAAAAGIALFALQPVLWPAVFKHYMEAVELQFSFNRDFSSSPAGLIANLLYDKYPYQKVSAIAYLAYAIPGFALLIYLSRLYFAGRYTLQRWVPVALTGVAFLNPRIMEYDVAPMALPMALVAWRVFARLGSRTRTIWAMSIAFVAINIIAAHPWRTVEGITVTVLFLAGALDLLAAARTTSASAVQPLELYPPVPVV